MKNNLSILKSGKIDNIVKAVIWKNIISYFIEQKKQDITKYLVSIKIKGTTILLRTNSPLINNEIINIEEGILICVNEKVKKIGVKSIYTHIKFN